MLHNRNNFTRISACEKIFFNKNIVNLFSCENIYLIAFIHAVL